MAVLDGDDVGDLFDSMASKSVHKDFDTLMKESADDRYVAGVLSLLATAKSLGKACSARALYPILSDLELPEWLVPLLAFFNGFSIDSMDGPSYYTRSMGGSILVLYNTDEGGPACFHDLPSKTLISPDFSRERPEISILPPLMSYFWYLGELPSTETGVALSRLQVLKDMSGYTALHKDGDTARFDRLTFELSMREALDSHGGDEG